MPPPISCSPSTHSVFRVLGSPSCNADHLNHSLPDTAATVHSASIPSSPSPSPAAPIVVWFRGHDLRVHDHAALDAAIASGAPVVALYVLERGAETDGASSYVRRLSASRTQHHSHSEACSSITTSCHSATASHHPLYGTAYTATSPSTDEDHHHDHDHDEHCEPWGPLSPNGGFALGRVQRWYLHHSLRVLREQLQHLGVTLVLRRVDCAEETSRQVLSVVRLLRAATVFWNKRYKPRAYPVDEAVKSALRKLNVASHDFDSETLIPPSTDYGRFNDFQGYTRFWINHMRLQPPPQPEPPLDPHAVVAYPRQLVFQLLSASSHYCSTPNRLPPFAAPVLPSVSDLELLDGLDVHGDHSPGDVSSIGCVAAARALHRFLNGDRFARFASDVARRDGMVTGTDLATSRLSPHVRFGEISPRVLFWSVVNAGATAQMNGDAQGLCAARVFLKNMSLREFGYYMLRRYPSAAWKPIMPEFEVFPWEDDSDGELTRAWKNGTTGFPIVDAAMRQLIREGWLHNRMRFLAASFFCKYLLLPWPVGAAHMVRTLVDGDEACNSLGWQWTAGCNSDSFPFSTLVNPLSLHTHTQSRTRAAAYVRKYVPELAHLPDSLVFTPWKASLEECAKYNITLLPLRNYTDISQSLQFNARSGDRDMTYYPSRIVTGPQARYRARRAMEVMRRIFTAQKQCRTLLVDHTQPFPGDEINPLQLESYGMVLDVDHQGDGLSNKKSISLQETTSFVSTITTQRKNTRSRDEQDSLLVTPARKRMRTQTGEEDRTPHVDAVQLRTPSTRRPHIVQTEVPVPKAITERADTKATGPNMLARLGDVGSVADQNVHIQIPKTTPAASRERISETPVGGGHRNPKRPRSPSLNAVTLESTPQLSDPSGSKTPKLTDDRLSVSSLLSPNHSLPTHPVSQEPRPNHRRAVAAELNFAMSGLPRLAQAASIQCAARFTPHAGTMPNMSSEAVVSPHLSTCPTTPALSHGRHPSPEGEAPRSKGPNKLDANTEMSAPDSRVSVGFSVTTGRKDSTPQLAQPPVNSRTAERPSLTVPSRMIRSSETFSNHSSYVVAPAPAGNQGVVVGMSRSMMQGNEGANSVAFNQATAAPTHMFHPSNIPVALMGTHIGSPQNQGTHMLIPFTPAAGHIPMQPITHHPGAVQAQGTPQGYVNMRAMGAPAQQTPGAPFTWYPTMHPYMGFRPAVLPQLQHPLMSSGHPALANPYQLDRTNVRSRPMQQNMAVPVPSQNTGAQSPRRVCPTTPLERQGIARRMAAMDYTDETYGGKHWEQWQAIALHLLNQYEFSEDTDRDTTRAYVRLCVLKDELRDANPSGPRVTVNHCKEVFRILNLPVTGEWDRRGHGGVRGPYVYGCMRKNGQYSSRR